MQHAFRVGQHYRDTGSYRNSDDQFLRWIRGPLDSGIKNTGGIRDHDAFVTEVTVSAEKVTWTRQSV
jgi:hypothetical protein